MELQERLIISGFRQASAVHRTIFRYMAVVCGNAWQSGFPGASRNIPQRMDGAQPLVGVTKYIDKRSLRIRVWQKQKSMVANTPKMSVFHKSLAHSPLCVSPSITSKKVFQTMLR
jgi:hypothetical protein